jgi:hypothetical protein
MRARFVGLVLIAMVAAMPVVAADARTDNRSKPVIVLHGLDLRMPPAPCGWMNPTAPKLRSFGHYGAAIVGYYASPNCDAVVNADGSHTSHYPTGHSGGGHTSQTDIRHLGYHLAWFIWNRYSSRGVPVDILAHSMGGLVARYALAATAQHVAGFPSYLLVEDAVTLGTPHRGFAAAGCSPSVLECSQMLPTSSLMTWLAVNAGNPQGSGGTDWTTIGSKSDSLVPATSATGMSAAHSALYSYPRMSHDGLISDTSDANDAVVDYRNGAVSATAVLAPRIMRWDDRSLFYGGW